ncbi:MAG: energy-coupling factor transporter transmembrane component T [Negativicutes bacterium]|nr:energy-coupling factor transporter transmembrane component T [Negativicutes bacterium]
MPKVAPLTKIIFTLLVSFWAMLLASPALLAIVVAGEVLLFVIARVSGSAYKALGSLGFFAALLAALQYALGSGLDLSLLIGLRMVAMTGSFILLFAATRVQDLSSALVRQLKIPQDYAFMFTATLRFIPDFFAEIKAVQEAQACRGYSSQGSLTKRFVNYLAIVQPLVLRAVTRSETMAMSLELRGFNRGMTGGYGTSIRLAGADYLAIIAMTCSSLALVVIQLHY